SNDGGRGGSAEGSAYGPGQPWRGTPSDTFDEPCVDPADPSVAGSWQGELDTYTLPSGSRSIRVDFKGSYRGADGLCGAVVFGSGDSPPVATDAKAWPPGVDAFSQQDFGRISKAAIKEGFSYQFYAGGTALDAGLATSPPALHASSVRFAVNLRQIYKSWCNL